MIQFSHLNNVMANSRTGSILEMLLLLPLSCRGFEETNRTFQSEFRTVERHCNTKCISIATRLALVICMRTSFDSLVYFSRFQNQNQCDLDNKVFCQYFFNVCDNCGFELKLESLVYMSGVLCDLVDT